MLPEGAAAMVVEAGSDGCADIGVRCARVEAGACIRRDDARDWNESTVR